MTNHSLHPARKPRPSPLARGFSLVEVTLALGISASALLVIFSLLPIGISSLQDTQRQIVEAEIYNKIGAELATTATFDRPVETTGSPRQNLLRNYCRDRFPACFDAEGNELTKSGSTIPTQTVFIARCTVEEKSAALEASWRPATSATAKDELLLGVVQIGYNSPKMRMAATPTATPFPAPLPAGIRQRVFLLSNHGS